MKRFLGLTIFFALTLFLIQPAFSESIEELKSIKEEIKALNEGQRSIQRDLQEIKKLLQAKPASAKAPEFKEVVINIDNDPFKGDKSAKLVLVEFSDYQ